METPHDETARAMQEQAPAEPPREPAARNNPGGMELPSADAASSDFKRLGEGERLVIVLEPVFMRPPVARPFANGREAVLALGILGPDNAVRMAQAEGGSVADAEWETLLSATLEEAEPLLAGATPVYHRGKDDVIQYALLRIEHPLAPMTVLTPGFLEMFRETLGDTVHVVMPAHSMIYVFPALASNLTIYGGKFLRAYDGAVTPLSLEVYEVGQDGIRAVGTFREDY